MLKFGPKTSGLLAQWLQCQVVIRRAVAAGLYSVMLTARESLLSQGTSASCMSQTWSKLHLLCHSASSAPAFVTLQRQRAIHDHIIWVSAPQISEPRALYQVVLIRCQCLGGHWGF